MAQQPSPVSTSPAQSLSLYRKYRPTSFDPEQLVGQEHVARTLRNAIVLDRVAHAYLFCGPRGTGKTSTARLLAKAVNCQAPDPNDRPCNKCESCLAINRGSVVDIIEIDAASNRGVDDIRDLREKVRYAPAQLAVKFYIIDEAHQLTRDAFNAFLKTLEEPPGHVKFVLATTEAEKLPDTVASRCQRFDFRRIPVDSALNHLRNVCRWEEIEAEEEALLLIARQATGSLRDALGLLDQLALYGEQDGDRRTLSAATVRQVLGLSDNERIVGLVRAIVGADPGEALRLISEASDQGEDVHQLNRQMIGYLRLLMHLRAGGSPPEADSVAAELAQVFSLDRLSQLVRTFSEVDAASNRSTYPHLPIELAFVRSIVQESPPTVSTQRISEQPAAPVASQAESSVNTSPPNTRRERRTHDPSTGSKPAGPKPAGQAPPEPATTVRRAPASGGARDDVLEHLAANWTHIRRDVKAANSRIAALLSSADPAAVTDTQIVLVAPYEFHRNKINEDASRIVIESVLQQYTHSNHQLVCVAPGDLPPAGAQRPEESRGVGGPPEQGLDPSAAAGDGAVSADPAASTSGSRGQDDSMPAEVANGTEGISQETTERDERLRSESGSEKPTAVDEGAQSSRASGEMSPEASTDDQAASEEELERLDAARRIFEARENS